jgi:teichuronic acid exporter
MSESLRKKTVHGLWWSLIDWAGRNGIQFVIGIILARLLLPEQFGLIGMLTIFIAVAQSFLDSGFGSALIQKQDANQTDNSSIFFFNVIVGVGAAGLLCLAAPWIAAFYRQPLLTPLTRVLSLNIVINSFGLIQTTLMVKRVDFKTQAKITTASAILSGAIGILLAVRGFGVWSLAIQSLSANACRTVLLWLFNSWRPSLVFSILSMRKMFSFGSRMLASGLLDTVFRNIYLVVIGRLYSANDVGFYSRALTMQQVPTIGMYSMVGRVTFPIFSMLQDDSARLKRGLRRALTTLVLINFPMMIGLSLTARPLMLILLTDKWAPCIPYLQLLCIEGMLYPLHAINVGVLPAKGRSDLFFRLEVIKKILITIGIIASCSWGITSLIIGQIVVSFICYFVNSYYTAQLVDYPVLEQAKDVLPYLGTSLAMGASVCLVQCIPFPNHWTLLFVETAVGALVYVVLCRGFRLQAFLELWEICRSVLPSAKPV